MNIAFARLNGKTTLSLDAAKYTRGTRLRLGIFNSWLKHGYNIKIYSDVVREKASLFGKPKYSQITDDINGVPTTEDVLFIENGSSNPLNTFKRNGIDVSYIERVRELINGSTCRIIYYQQDGRLNFPFSDFKDVDMSRFTILTHAFDMQKFKEVEYKKYYDKLNFQFLPLCYDDETYPLMPTARECANDLVYVGNEHDKNRTEKLLKYYDIPDLNIELFGNWQSSPSKNIKLNTMEPFGITQRIYNTAKCVIQIGDKNFEQYKMPTTRIIEVIRAGTPLFFDIDIDLPDFNTYRLINNHETKYLISQLDYQARCNINQQQLKFLHNWSEVEWQKIL